MSKDVRPTDVLCVGETIMDVMTRPAHAVELKNEYSQVESIVLKTGGDALNNAVDLAAIGNSVAYAGRISTDFCGQAILDFCAARGIDMSRTVRTDTPHTKMNILVGSGGERSFFYYPGVSAEFTAEDVDPAWLPSVRILQLSSTFHLPRFDGAAGAAGLLRSARAAGTVTSMDVTQDLTGRWNEILEPCYPYLDYFLPSEEQAALLAGTGDERRMAEFFLERGVGTVVIKLGSRGSYCRSREESFYCGCYNVPVAETTGAGDAFVAGFLSGLLRALPLRECVRLATAASAHVIQAVGANTGIRKYEDLRRFMERQPLEFRQG